MPTKTKLYDASTNYVTTLAAGISAGATSLTVASSGSLTATTGTDQFYALVGKANVAASREVVLVTNISGTTWTVTRGQSGTTAVSHDAGDGVEPVVTAGALEDLVNVQEGGVLVVGTRDVNFNASQFDVTDVAGVATIALAPAGTPAVGTDSIWQAKGDTVAATSLHAAVRVAVGANGRVLMADSTQTAGVKWEALAAGASFAAPSESVDIADTAAEGVAATTVRSDHRHAVSAPAAAYPLDVAAAEADGTATTPARSDHVHAHGTGYLPDAHHARAHDHSTAGDTTALVPASLNVTGFVRLSGDISPAQLTASVNDYNPTDLATAAVLRLTADAEWSITGLQGGADGRLVVLANVGANTINLVDESGSSTAAYRFALDVGLALTADTAATLLYDSTSSRWRLIGIGKAASASTSALLTDTAWDASGDLVKGTGNNTAAKLSRGTAGQLLQVNSGGTDIEWGTPTLSTLTDTNTSAQVLKAPVRVATAAAGTLATSFENGDTVDGIVLATGNRILIKDQAAGAENGLYTVNASGAPTRATDADASAELPHGFLVYVREGTAGANKVYKHTTAAAITLNTTALTFAELAGSGGGGAVATDTIWDAAGDLAVGSDANTAARLAMGTALQVLRVNAGATTLEWAAAGGGGGGATINTGTDAAKGTGTAGDLYLPSDGFQAYRSTGAAQVPWGPLFPLTAPVSGDFAWINQGTATISTTNGGVFLNAPAVSGSNLRIRKKAAPATPYTITAGFLVSAYPADYCTWGLVWRQSSDGKCVTAGAGNSSQHLALSVGQYSTATAFSANYAVTTANIVMIGGVFWVQMSDNGTDRIVRYSGDGQNWWQYHTIGRTNFLTADEVGFQAQSNNTSGPCGVTLIHWKES